MNALTERELHLMRSAWHGRSGWPGMTFEAWLAMRLPSDRINAEGLAQDCPHPPESRTEAVAR